MSQELPNDITIETSIIGTIIKYPDKYNDIAKYIVSDSVWYDNKCKTLWNIVTA